MNAKTEKKIRKTARVLYAQLLKNANRTSDRGIPLYKEERHYKKPSTRILNPASFRGFLQQVRGGDHEGLAKHLEWQKKAI